MTKYSDIQQDGAFDIDFSEENDSNLVPTSRGDLVPYQPAGTPASGPAGSDHCTVDARFSETGHGEIDRGYIQSVPGDNPVDYLDDISNEAEALIQQAERDFGPELDSVLSTRGAALSRKAAELRAETEAFKLDLGNLGHTEQTGYCRQDCCPPRCPYNQLTEMDLRMNNYWITRGCK